MEEGGGRVALFFTFDIMNLTLLTLIRWEQMSGRAFSSFDFRSKDDVLRLMYCSTCLSSDRAYTYEVFRESVREHDIVKYAREVGEEIALERQFESESEEKKDEGKSEDESSVRLSDTVFDLVSEGADMDYMLHRLHLCDLPLVAAAYTRKRKDRFAYDRMWAFIKMEPLIDVSKMPNGPIDLLKFPWEEMPRKDGPMKADEFEMYMEMARNNFKKSKENGGT
jgi:hypothetical protein